ncbi:MAG TPA: MBL fold metallo-hydrolase [Candidatus Eisenbacteria bacterium]
MQPPRPKGRSALLALSLLIPVLALASPAGAQLYMPGAKPAVPPKDSTLTIRVRKLAPGVFAAKVNYVWTGWVELPEGILVIDASMADSSGKALADTIRSRSPGLPFRYLVLTSAHFDHDLGGRRFLDAGATLVTHASVADEIDSVLQVTPDPKREMRVERSARFGSKLRPVEVLWLGQPAVSRGDLVVYLPAQRLLFSGDLISYRSVPWLMDPDLDVPGWIASLDSLFTKAFAIDSIVPGHGVIGPKNDAVNFTKYYLQDARMKAEQNAAWNSSVLAVKQWGFLGAYEGLEFYNEVHFMNMRRLFNEAKGIKTPGRVRTGAFRK